MLLKITQKNTSERKYLTRKKTYKKPGQTDKQKKYVVHLDLILGA